jgi:hypothetical protein
MNVDFRENIGRHALPRPDRQHADEQDQRHNRIGALEREAGKRHYGPLPTGNATQLLYDFNPSFTFVSPATHSILSETDFAGLRQIAIVGGWLARNIR